jgi:hypothetical protein
MLAVESVAFGLGYTGVLIWAGTALVASFTPFEAIPYWPAIPYLRNDTTGVLAFAVAIIALVASKYLQLRRRGDTPVRSAARPVPGPVARPASVLMLQAMAETAMVLATGLVAYLSVNAVTHPVTLRLQLTHLWPWPTEGTTRVIGLGICLVAVAVRRYLRAATSPAGRAAPVPRRADVSV